MDDPCLWTQLISTSWTPHCKEDSIYVFPEMKLHGRDPNFHIHVSVSDLYTPTIGLPTVFSAGGGPIVGHYKSLTDT